MKREPIISTQNRDELEMLALEISELRGILREISLQVLRIERRIRSVLPHSELSKTTRVGKSRDPHFAKGVIVRLTKRAKEGAQIENELRRMTVKRELASLARELGMTNRELPPKDDLIRRIATRIRQKASVAYGISDGDKK